MQQTDTNFQIDMAMLDFIKAFDTIPHDKLLGNLQHYCIQDPILNWISIFLKDKISVCSGW